MKKYLSIIFRIGISLLLLYILFKKVDRVAVFHAFRHVDLFSLSAAFLLFILSYLIAILRWEMILKALQIELPVERVAVSFLGGTFFNLFLPSTIGGDVVRALHLVKHTKKTEEIIASIFLDRLSGYIGLVLIALSALFFGYRLVEEPAVLIALSIFVFVLIALLIVLFNKFLYRKINAFFASRKKGSILEPLRDLHDEIHYFRHKKGVIVVNILFSVVLQFICNLVFYFIAKSLGLNIGLIYFLIFIPIIGAITLLPISIGGLGLRDASTIYFFTKIGTSRDAAFAMSLINFSFLIIVGLAGGLIYVLTLHPRRL